METNKYIEKIKGIAKKIQEHLPVGVKKWAISLAFVATVLTACGKTVETNNPTNPVPDTTIETTVEPVDEEKPAPNVTEDHNKTPGDEEVKPTNNNDLPEPTFVQTSENNYTVTVNCSDNSNAPEVQTAQGYSFVENSELTAGVSPELMAAIVANGMKDGKNNGQIRFDAYKDYVFQTYDFAFNMQTPAVFTDTPDQYDGTMVITRSAYESFDDGYQYILPLLVQESLSATNYNLPFSLARIDEGPTNWEEMMQRFEAETGLSREEVYAKYDPKFVYETLGIEYPGYAEAVISMIPSDEIGVTRIENGIAYSQISYTIDRANVKIK